MITKRDDKGRIEETNNIGNNYSLKFKTPEERKKLCDEYCKYIETGKNKEAFWLCDMQTFRRYMKQYPQDFDLEKIGESERKGQDVRETILHKISIGEIDSKGAATATIFAMKNKFEKYKEKSEVEVTGKQFYLGCPPSKFTNGDLASKNRSKQKKSKPKK